ncbi:hypothetical protein BRD56_11515 [Thermoplasmatales archaeon SW_10_69_26]|nr:MAG: hypothetical protein BRD56_11515 [Thermoplasmatales archaeon SW_10_69_26]
MGTRARCALLVAVIAGFALASGLVAAQEGDAAEDELTGPTEATIEVRLGPGQDDPFATHPEEMTVGPNTEVTFHVVNVGGVAHDFAFLSQDFEHAEEDVRQREDGNGEAVKTPLLDPGEEYNLTVTFGEDYEGEVGYICSVPGHQSQGMEGTLAVGATGGGEEGGIEDFGVDYLAYWVGVISFVIIFIVLFATFFFLRYGESKNVTDHRAGGPETITVAAGAAEGDEREMVEPILPSPGRVAQVLIAVALIGLGIYLIL